ncbi:MAG TPA: ABC transporter ATP-binding protein [Thermomicrobiales bacterium]
MSEVVVRGLGKSFGAVRVLEAIDLRVPAGSLTVILGPSGCGKTTLLRLIAGFERPDCGTIVLGGQTVCDARQSLPPERRQIGYVAQEGALFPHLNVAANITFGLSSRERRAQHRVAELLALVELDAALAQRYPHELSGGQQQRVALARALAPRPRVVLLDEPFSALDAGLREGTRRAVAHALAAAGATAILVTHDQAEALSLATQVAVMRDGRLAQVGTPAQLYRQPADLGVATFLGDAVILPAEIRAGRAECDLGSLTVRGAAPDGAAEILLRPEQLILTDLGGTVGVAARVLDHTYYGKDLSVRLQLPHSGATITARVPGFEPPQHGQHVRVVVQGDVIAYPR